MSTIGPGTRYREDIGLMQFTAMFHDEASAMAWNTEITDTTGMTLQGSIRNHAVVGAGVYMGESDFDTSLHVDHHFSHGAHSRDDGEYCRRMAHPNGVVSFRSFTIWAHKGVHCILRVKELGCLQEFTRRNNVCNLDSIHQKTSSAIIMVGRPIMSQDMFQHHEEIFGTRP